MPEDKDKDKILFIQYLNQEKITHKEHRHRHVVQKLLVSGGVLGIGQLVQKPELAFFVTMSVPFLCLVHDIYIFLEHYKVARIGHFLREKMNLESTDYILKWKHM